MCSTCHHCHSEVNNSKEEKRKPDNATSWNYNGEGLTFSCRRCREKQEREPLKQDRFTPCSTPFSTPVISPTTSLSSSDRSFSSCSELSVDANSYERGEQEEASANSYKEDIKFKMTRQFRKSHSEGLVNQSAESSIMIGSGPNDIGRGNESDIMRDVDVVQSTSGQQAENKDVEKVNSSPDNESEDVLSAEHEMDLRIWEPPEPEDPEVDFEGSVAYNDDDDDCGDGTMWGMPSSLSHFRDEFSLSFKLKEEKQRAMEEVLSGKFKNIVSHLLVTMGVSSLGTDGTSWVDIVTSLSWEAASSLKPDAKGKAVDPTSYVKVKCIATGSRNESEVIKGLVFKKHAAHKHMPTKFKNPKLLLIRGMLGTSSFGLSSLNSMEQEKGYLKAVMEMIEICQPNVILVEKTVSRDIQESILAKGMTLVFDMKLHRLERVARFTGSPIISAETLTSQKLKKCESFHIEKFVEEHVGFAESGRRPSKTLMFIEGCSSRLGCTVLLKGSHSDELKKIKYVVQCAVVIAHHLMLETSFIVDQRAMFSTMPFAVVADVWQTVEQCPTSKNGNLNVPCLDDSTAETESGITTDIPISSGLHEDTSDENPAKEGEAVLSSQPYNPVIFSGFSALSASLKKVIGDNFPLKSAAVCPSISTYLGLCEKEPNGKITEKNPATDISEAPDICEIEIRNSSVKEMSQDGQLPSMSVCSETPLNLTKTCGADNNQLQNKEGANAALDSQSILVLMSCRNALKGTVCEQSHFSHIMFYKNFDIPLGKFLQDNLLNQGSQCTTCGELPESHFYYYAHRNKQLSIQVKRLPNKCLPGEAEGKLWMWSRCGKCRTGNGVSNTTKRVLISTASCSLSFGKFLELSLCHHSNRSASCGHSLHWDFLHFFGSGSMVAMLRYSSVTTYTVSVPPQKLLFSNSTNIDWLKGEFENLYTIGMLLFTEVESSLKQIGSQFIGSMLKLQGSLQEFHVIVDMLKQERAAFEEGIQNVIAKKESADEALHKLLSLNQIRWELLLESCIWDKRLHSLLLRDPAVVSSETSEKGMQEQPELKMEGNRVGGNGGQQNNSSDKSFIDNSDLKVKPDVSANLNELLLKEVCAYVSERATLESVQNRIPSKDSSVNPVNSSNHHPGDTDLQSGNIFPPKNLVVEKPVMRAADLLSNFMVDPNSFGKGYSPRPLLSILEKLNGWYWMPFSELKEIYTRDLGRGFVPRFEYVSSYTPENLPAVHKLICEEGSRLHIPLGTDNYLVSDYEGELSSIIACALALLKDLPLSAGVFNEDGRKESEISPKRTDSLYNLIRIPFITSPHWSINGSSDSDSINSALSISSEDSSRFSSFDGLNLLESLVSQENLSPEVSLGASKSLAKGKYSVRCLYANQFRDLRGRCCPSELDYIDSLSRCKAWDAKGGKSKAFFSKTLDGRFIIKEIKKTEYESFEKFAPQYFKYMNECFDLGNQTCLAKVLGIYQVTVRQPKSGKEVRHDLMVMENLTFGHNIVRQYDLKGALHARFNAVVDGSEDVLLDQNFVNDMNTSPVYVSNKAKRLLQRAVWNDTTFLNSVDVMDYSLLVGVDTRNRVLVCGIIDYLRQYTWDKHLETWVKSSLVPKNVLPTVISPIEYKKRFRKFMSTHFLSVPDHWCAEESSDPCELCGLRTDDSFKFEN